jgi:hypothetical protein
MYGKSLVFARAGVQTPRPNDLLFVAQEVYDWRLLDELGTSAYWAGSYPEGQAACEEVLRRVEQGLAVPDDDVRRIRKNLTYYESKVGKP